MEVSIVLITIEVPKPVMSVAGNVRITGGEITKRRSPNKKIPRPTHLVLARPNL
jgi:hypothetical protein